MALFDLWTRSGSPVLDLSTDLDFSLWARDGHPVRKLAAVVKTISPTGVGSAEALGVASVQTVPTLNPTGVASGEALGAPILVPWITPTGVPSGEALGAPSLTSPILPSGVPSAGALGVPSMVPWVQPLGVPSEEALGGCRVGFSPPIPSAALSLLWIPTRAVLQGLASRVQVSPTSPTRPVAPGAISLWLPIRPDLQRSESRPQVQAGRTQPVLPWAPTRVTSLDSIGRAQVVPAGASLTIPDPQTRAVVGSMPTRAAVP